MTKKTSSVGQGAPPPHAESQARGAPRWGGRRRGNEPSPRLPARLQHTPGPHEGLRAGTAGPRAPENGRPSRGAQVPGSRGGPGGGGGARRAGEGRPAALTRPGTAPGPPLHLSRSQLTRGGGGQDLTLCASGNRRPAGNDERGDRPGPSVTGSRASDLERSARPRAASDASSVSGPARPRLPGPGGASPAPPPARAPPASRPAPPHRAAPGREGEPPGPSGRECGSESGNADDTLRSLAGSSRGGGAPRGVPGCRVLGLNHARPASGGRQRPGSSAGSCPWPFTGRLYFVPA